MLLNTHLKRGYLGIAGLLVLSGMINLGRARLRRGTNLFAPVSSRATARTATEPSGNWLRLRWISPRYRCVKSRFAALEA